MAGKPSASTWGLELSQNRMISAAFGPQEPTLPPSGDLFGVFAFDLDGNLGEGGGQGINQAIDRFSAAGTGFDGGNGGTFARSGRLQAE